MDFRRTLAALLLPFALLFSIAAQTAPRRIVLDTDPGTDDALALMLALNSPDLKVEAITVVPGNVTAEQGLDNALRMVSLANRCDIPVAGGARHPLNQKLVTAELWHGRNGLGNIELPAPKCKVDARFGPDLIVELVHKYPHQVTLVPVGPLTNIALAVSKDPAIASLVEGIVIMGGSVSGGNTTGAAEANIYNDPEAAQIVFNAGWTVTMVGLDVGNKTLMTDREVQELASSPGTLSRFAAQVGKFMVENSRKYGFEGAAMYDPLAVGVAIDPALVTTQLWRVDVETRGEFTRGETVANRGGYNEHYVLNGDHYTIDRLEKVKPNARVCVEVQPQRFLSMFVDRVKGK
jgi:inosine-uridine nucleoside N-ribohydrolase